MEAASARAAHASEMFGYGGRAPSQLQRFIAAACSPENYEPNLALNLEIADLINSKKGTAPREAAVAIVQYINHRNANVALLALALLDICVKNCGYPFHLQISTKEFLNELVRRFPERPPVRPTRVQTKILEAIQEWRMTICETSRYKEDLGFIRDMHRLLLYKGYTFPEVRREDAAVLNPSDNLKSAEEMEEEEREAQSAKLQELIRRGTPEDLQEANRLMKIMAGYDTRSKTDFRAKAAEEVAKVVAKARLLEERLDAMKRGEGATPTSSRDGDVFEELVAAIRSAQPKIQKMCEEESDDTAAVAKLLEINDSLHRVVERYRLMKKGDLEGAAKLAAGAPISLSGPAAKQGGSAAAEVSLIDLDADGDANNSSAAGGSSQAGSLENDLLGLSIGDSSGSFGQGGGIALGLGANTGVPGPALLSSMTQNSTAGGTMPSSAAVSQTATPQPNYSSSAFAPPPQKPATDPFAAIASGSFSSKPASPSPPKPVAATTAADDDEWSFSSAAAAASAPSVPKEHKIAVSSSDDLDILLHATRPTGGKSIHLKFDFINRGRHRLEDMDFQLAVTKAYELLTTQLPTGHVLLPQSLQPITEAREVWHAGDRNRKVDSIKLRWRLSYKRVPAVAGSGTAVPVEEKGEIPEFSIA